MPELPEVETWRKLAESHIGGKRVDSVSVQNDRLIYREVSPQTVARKLRGRTVLTPHRRGKYLWFELDRPPYPVFHFGMGGGFLIYFEGEERPKWWKLDIRMDDGTHLVYRNVRRIGRIGLANDPLVEPPVSSLGPDPLHDPLCEEELSKRLEKRTGLIKPLLLNQSVFAGVGNWIADEVLYQAGISPFRKANSLSTTERHALHTQLEFVIRRAVDVDAASDRFPTTWLFHHRWGKEKGATTSRGEAIQFDTIAGRTAAWVPTRQI